MTPLKMSTKHVMHYDIAAKNYIFQYFWFPFFSFYALIDDPETFFTLSPRNVLFCLAHRLSATNELNPI